MVLLDLNLPRLHGIEVPKRVRSRPEFVGLPIVVFPSSEQALDRERAGELGANDYIVKPAHLARFVEVAATLKRAWLS